MDLGRRLRQRRLQMSFGARVGMDVTAVMTLPVALIIVSALVMHSWSMSYNLLVGNTEPNAPNVTNQFLGYLLSLVGWLMIPSVVGAIAGEAASDILERYKGRPLLDLIEEARRDLGSTNGDTSPVYVDAEGLEDDAEPGPSAASDDGRRSNASRTLLGCVAFLLVAVRIWAARRQREAVERPLRGRRGHWG